MPLRSNDRLQPPFSHKEIQEKLRSGKLKIVSAPQDLVKTYDKECRNLLILIALFLGVDNPQKWAYSCFITDQSCIGDFFGTADEETPAMLKTLSEELGFPVERESYLCEIAAKMRGVV